RIYLFLTGPHLNPFGVKLDNFAISAISDNKGTFTEVIVGPDNTWNYEWDTSKVQDLRETGTYTIYVITESKNKEDLSPENYKTTSITIKNSFISATMSHNKVARGDECFITGTAEGNPNSVYLWVFGPNYQLLENPINVNSDASFSFNFTRDLTKKLESGQYFVVIQHPGQNGRADIRHGSHGPNSNFIWKDDKKVGGITTIDISQERPSDAAEKLLEMLNLPSVDDIYTKLSFLVEEPNITINPIEPKVIGEFFTITGSTNLNVDDELLIELKQDLLFESNQHSARSFDLSGVCRVIRGESENKWSFDVDCSILMKGKYILEVTSLETGNKTKTTIDFVEN
ncbi:MAG: MEMAR_RS02690 family S-layer glycoprotein, partial [Methanoregula sp.]